jgi:hypothetical protein
MIGSSQRGFVCDLDHTPSAPAVMVARSTGTLRKLMAITVTMAAASATITDHTPPIADRVTLPHRGDSESPSGACPSVPADHDRNVFIDCPFR